MRDAAQTASSRFPVYVSKAVSQDGFFVAVIYFRHEIHKPVRTACETFVFSQLLGIIHDRADLLGNQASSCLGVDVDLAVNPILISRESFDRVILRGEDIKLLEDCSPDALRQPSS